MQNANAKISERGEGPLKAFVDVYEMYAEYLDQAESLRFAQFECVIM